MIALIQERSADHPGTAHGLYVATGFFLRSVVVLIVGVLGDWLGLRTAFMVSGVIGFLALPLAFRLPSKDPGGES